MPSSLGPQGQLGRARAQADVEAMGQGQGAVAGVLELGDLVVVDADTGTPPAWSASMASRPRRARREDTGSGLCDQGPDLVDHETRQHDAPGQEAGLPEHEEVAVHHRRAVDQEGGPRRRLGGTVEQMGEPRRPDDLLALGHADAHARRAQHPGEGGHERVVDARVDEGHDGEPGHEPEEEPGRPHHRPREHLAGRASTGAASTAPRRPRSMRRPMIPPRRYDAEGAQGDPDHGRGRVAADLVPHRETADGPGDHEEKPEHLDEDHALSPHSHVLQRHFPGYLPDVGILWALMYPHDALFGERNRLSHRRYVKTLAL